MGMTIDEHIAQLKKLKSFHNGSYGASINYALDTMRKYQKIQKIVERGNREELGYEYIGEKITEVMEE